VLSNLWGPLLTTRCFGGLLAYLHQDRTKTFPINNFVQLRERIAERLELLKAIIQIEKARSHVSEALLDRKTL